jgi:hypothetical protein
MYGPYVGAAKKVAVSLDGDIVLCTRCLCFVKRALVGHEPPCQV